MTLFVNLFVASSACLCQTELWDNKVRRDLV